METNEIKELLREGEELRWYSSVKPCKLLSAEAKDRQVKSWIISTIIYLVILISYLCTAEVIQFTVIGIIVALMIYNYACPYLDWKKVCVQKYWGTNERIIAKYKDNSIYFINLKDLDGYKRVAASDGDSFVLGSAFYDFTNKHLRWRACRPVSTDVADRSITNAMVIYKPENPDGLEGLLQ